MLDAEDIIKKWTAAELLKNKEKENNTRAIAVKTDRPTNNWPVRQVL